MAFAFARRPAAWLSRRCLRGLPVLVHEVSRRAVGSSTTPGQTGTRAIAPVYVAFRALQRRRRPDCIFSELNTHPAYSPVYASPCTSRCPAQNSGPSRSLVLSRKNFAFSASCRFSPAHCNPDFSTTTLNLACLTIHIDKPQDGKHSFSDFVGLSPADLLRASEFAVFLAA